MGSDVVNVRKMKPDGYLRKAIEPSVILTIEKADLLFLYTHYPKFDRNFRVIIENRVIDLENRVLQNISATAAARYKIFLEKFPDLSRRLPNAQIASFLGITPEFLSKLRSKMSRT